MKNMELLQAMLESGAEVGKLTIIVQGEPVEFRYKPLGYLAKSRCVSGGMEYVPETNAAGGVEVKARFHLDTYRRMALKEMFGDKSLGNPIPFSDSLLDSLSVEIGEQFEVVIPDPFVSGQQVAQLKKEPGDSSEESAPSRRKTKT